MQNMSKPSPEELQTHLDALLSASEQSSADWLKRMIYGFHATIAKDPLSYRVFGPWWWQMKRLLIEQGNFADFGIGVDAELIEATDYGAPDLNMLAVFMAYDVNFDLGLLYSSEHNVAMDNGEAIQYTLIDEDMEMLALECASARSL